MLTESEEAITAILAHLRWEDWERRWKLFAPYFAGRSALKEG